MVEAQPLSDSESLSIRFRKPIVTGLLVICVTFGGFGAWAAWAPIEGAVVAPGIVAVSGKRKTVQHLEGGIVQHLYIKEGDSVVAGQKLIKLDDTQLKTQLDIYQSQYFIALATEARLHTERDEESTIRFSNLLFEGDARAMEAIDSQTRVFMARKAALEGEQELLRQKEEQLKSKVKGINAIVKGKQELLVSYADEIKDYKRLVKQGFSDKVRLRELQRNYSVVLSEVAELEADAIAANLEVGEVSLKQLQVIKDFRSNVVDQLGSIKSQLFDLDEKIRGLKDRLTRTQIKAPVKGIVLDLAIHTVGGVIQQGDRIMDIVPQAEELVLEVKIQPKDIDRVYVGQTTHVRFSAFNSRTTPTVEGKLARIAADALIDEKTGQPFYSARVELTQKSITLLADLALHPGMPAEVYINTGARTMLEYVVRPLSDGLAKSFTED